MAYMGVFILKARLFVQKSLSLQEDSKDYAYLYIYIVCSPVACGSVAILYLQER